MSSPRSERAPAAGAAPAGAAAPAVPLLELTGVEVIYEGVILVLRGLSLAVEEGEIVALLGANGAGKTTALKAVCGLLPSEHGEVTEGEVRYRGEAITRRDAAEIVRAGVSLVMEGRRVFEHLSVTDNLLAGAHARRAGAGARVTRDGLDTVYAYFPRLRERARQPAGYLSGGEQQMLAIGRALMARPQLMLLDEPSLGLSPLLVAEIFAIIARLAAELGTTILMVEQNAHRALEIADRGYVMESGRIVLEGPAAELAVNPDVREFYLGSSAHGQRRSYRESKRYRRRKRWL
jgi:branched-chain amino acid transport system ATP-binding protein